MKGASSGPDQPIERIERFRNDLADLHERWNNRLVLEGTSLAEAYLNGRLEILSYGDWNIGTKDVNWAVRISPASAIGKLVSAKHPRSDNSSQGDSWDKQVMFVVVVQDIEGPERLVRSVLRPYIFEKKVFSVGDGFLYRIEGAGGYKVFPNFEHRKVWLRLWIDSSNNPGAQMVKCSPQVMERISDGERECLGNRFGGAIDKLIASRLCVGRHNVRFHRKGIETGGQWASEPNQLINVAVGPLNL
jgi:hypothetical protein